MCKEINISNVNESSLRLGGTVSDREVVTTNNEVSGKDSTEITKRVAYACSEITRVPTTNAPQCVYHVVASDGLRATGRIMKIKGTTNDSGCWCDVSAKRTEPELKMEPTDC